MPARNLLRAAVNLFRGNRRGQNRSPSVVPTGPVPFGYKMAWISVKAPVPGEVVSFLQLKDSRQFSWKDGIDLAYEEGADDVFVTPQIHGWVLVVGWSAAAIADPEPSKSFYNTLNLLSARFGEAQAFATHRVPESHLWMLARQGVVVRSFYHVGESGDLLDNLGQLTDAEGTLGFFREPQDHWHPSEEDVMSVAGGWSIDPTQLTEQSGPAEFGVAGRIGLLIE